MQTHEINLPKTPFGFLIGSIITSVERNEKIKAAEAKHQARKCALLGKIAQKRVDAQNKATEVKILSALKELKTGTTSDIADKTGLGFTVAKRHLLELTERELVVCGGTKKMYVWSMVGPIKRKTAEETYGPVMYGKGPMRVTDILQQVKKSHCAVNAAMRDTLEPKGLVKKHEVKEARIVVFEWEWIGPAPQ